MRPFTLIAAIIFALIALVHAYRIATGFTINIGGTEVSQAVSWIGLIVAAVLSFGLFRESKA